MIRPQIFDRARRVQKTTDGEVPPLPASELLPPLPLATQAAAGEPSRRRKVLAVTVSCLLVTCSLTFIIYTLSQQTPWRRIAAMLNHGSRRGQTGGNNDGMVAEASAPIPRDPQATRMEDDRRAVLTWAKRTMLGGYDRSGRRNARWNAAAHDFIEHALPWWAGLHDYTVGAADLVPQARNVLRLGCDDPLVLYLAALAEERADRQSSVAGPLFSRAVVGFQNTPYLRGVAMVAATELVADCKRRRDGTDESKPVKQWWLFWFKQALSDGSFSPDDQTVLANALSPGEWTSLFEEHRDACCQSIEAAGDRAVAPWLRLALSGARYIHDAWKARGFGYANTVTAEGWRVFAENLASARRDLTASWQLNPRRPEAAALMITVTMGQSVFHGPEGVRTWLDRAVRAQVDYYSAYNRFGQSLFPQWEGSMAAIRAFGMNCASTEAYDTEVPLQLKDALISMKPPGYDDPEAYAALERMYAGYEAAPSQAGRRVNLHSSHAWFAQLTGRHADAYRLMKEVNFVLSPEMAEKLANSQAGDNYLERIAAYGGAGGNDAQMGDQLLTRRRSDQALDRFKVALAAESSDPRAAMYLRSRISRLETERQLTGGNWVSFQPTEGQDGRVVGWTSKLGTWRVAPDGALIGQAGASGLMLVNDVQVGNDFEVRGEFDFLPGAPSEEQAGVVFGHPDMEGEDWQSFRVKRNGPEGAVATVSCHWYDGPKRAVTVPTHNVFVLQSWHGLIMLTINGEVLFRSQRLDKGQVSDGTGLVGLGGYAHRGNPFSVAYRKLQLRRLTSTSLSQN